MAEPIAVTTTKPKITETLVRETVKKVAKQWEENLTTALGGRPNLRADATLILQDEGLSGNDIRIATNVYTCLLLNFEGYYIMDWECGPWECIVHNLEGKLPPLHQDNPEREYHIQGGELHFTIETFKYLDRQFGTVAPEVPAYFNRNGPLFEVMAKELDRHVRWSMPLHPNDYAEISPKLAALQEQLCREAVADVMLCWDSYAGM